MNDKSIMSEIQYGYLIDDLWAKIKTTKDDKKFAKDVEALEMFHPEIHTRACYDKYEQFIERMFMKQVGDV
jgi:hypothetical protein